MRTQALILSSALLFAACADAADVTNFRQYTPSFASSGQPNPNQLQALADAGFERVIYVALSDHDNALANEDRLVSELGMSYVQIPVVWNKPSPEHFATFAAVMGASEKKTLLHCQVNYRASAFALLYRVIYHNVPLTQAKADMNEVWTPTEEWHDFIFAVLRQHDIEPNCTGCDWTPWVP